MYVSKRECERERECVSGHMCVVYACVSICECVYVCVCINHNEHDNNKQPIKLSKYFAKIMGMVLTNLNFEESCPSFWLSCQ